jgi:hypothetical protein
MSVRILASLNLVSASSDPLVATSGDMYFNTVLNQVKVYNGTVWNVVGSGGGLTISATPPSGPSVLAGSMWFDSNTGQTFVYYNNYWLEIGAGSGSGAGGGTDAATALAYSFLTMGA